MCAKEMCASRTALVVRIAWALRWSQSCEVCAAAAAEFGCWEDLPGERATTAGGKTT
jgi:hypothetical protein